MSSPGATAVLFLVLGGLVLGGCGSGSRETVTAKAPVILDTERVERAIEESIRTKRGITAHVSCPAGVRQAKGRTFRCVAITKTGTTAFVVRQRDDKGNVAYAAQ